MRRWLLCLRWQTKRSPRHTVFEVNQRKRRSLRNSKPCFLSSAKLSCHLCILALRMYDNYATLDISLHAEMENRYSHICLGQFFVDHFPAERYAEGVLACFRGIPALIFGIPLATRHEKKLLVCIFYRSHGPKPARAASKYATDRTKTQAALAEVFVLSGSTNSPPMPFSMQ
jgi:hypothetical protein